MYKYRVYDKTINKFRNVKFNNKVEDITVVDRREFRAYFASDPERPHLLRIISGPVEEDD